MPPRISLVSTLRKKKQNNTIQKVKQLLEKNVKKRYWRIEMGNQYKYSDNSQKLFQMSKKLYLLTST